MKKRIVGIVFILAFIGGYLLMGQGDFFGPEYQEVRVEDSTFESKFYFEQLDEEDQLVYKEIYQGVMDHEESITVHSLDGKEAGAILQNIIYDFPGIFWCDGGSDTLTYEESHVDIEPTYVYSLEEREKMQAEIDTQANAILSQISAESSDYDKIKYVYETLVNTVTYVEDAPDNQNIYSALVRKETVCAGYSKANQYLLEQLGVYCIYVIGTADGDSHGWNIVKCNGLLCIVDVTWADPTFSETEQTVTEEILYDYLCCSDKSIAATHQADERYAYPECSSDEWEYYHLNQMYYESAERQVLLDAMYATINDKGDSTTFKFADANVYQQGKQLLEGELMDKAGTYLCDRYGLQQVEFFYSEYEDMNRFVINWSYE